MRQYLEHTKKWLLGFGLFALANFLWWVIISFIDGEWNITNWYLYTRGWGRFILLVIESLVIAGTLETIADE